MGGGLAGVEGVGGGLGRVGGGWWTYDSWNNNPCYKTLMEKALVKP